VIQLENLHKKFGRRVAVEDLSLHIPEGSLYALLGHNGAGKSTTIGMLLGQVIPGNGRVLIGGQDVQENRAVALASVGAIFETPSFYDYLSGWRNLEILCSYHQIMERPEIAEAVALVGLEKRIHDPVRAYSHGMRQRLALAQSLLPRPRILILDEPSEGLDPEGIYDMRELIRKLHAEYNLTILICSHLLAEVEQICTHVAILRQGQLLTSGEWKRSNSMESLEAFYLRHIRQSGVAA
jgi:ABC-2 type transport system ATP-binding protein